ncbi:uncharacterized protein LOC116412812 [Galleria mellonella]|uniref:Uncharacterized protein LOC116412812 n=1 Tax=Galleria mellonella TaxID=7137 RepID=A0A6J3BRJ2_GALME|nr:uncharacterized protein LOC116412812 [Galleria mellonella]
MKYHLTFSLTTELTLLAMVSCNIIITPKHRNKRSYADNFNVLLNLYKMNPLKRSNIFKTFSNNMLLTNRAANATLHFDSNESIREKQMRVDRNLKHIEDIIHVEKSRRPEINQPDYIADTSPEIYSNDNVINYLVANIGHKHDREMKQKKLNYLFEDTESNEDSNSVFKPIKATSTLNVLKNKLHMTNKTDVKTTDGSIYTTITADTKYLNKDFNMKFSEAGVIIM